MQSSTKKDTDAQSISLEETNKIRLELGLNPLDLNDSKKENNLSEEKQAALSTTEVKTRILASRAKRTRDLLTKGGTILDNISDDDINDLDDVNKWISKSRLKNEKVDSKFVEDDSTNKSNYLENKLDNNDEFSLDNLHVAHKKQNLDLKLGDTITLTLKDQRIIDESGELNDDGPDVLENEFVRKYEQKKQRDREKKLGIAGVYNPSNDDEDNEDEDPELLLDCEPVKKKREILHHYDEWAIENKTVKRSLESELAKGFKLSDIINDKNNQQDKIPPVITLESTEGIQKDFYTSEEMSSFSKNIGFKKSSRKRPLGHKKKRTEDETTNIPFKLNIDKPITIDPRVEDDNNFDDTYLYERLAKQRKNITVNATPEKPDITKMVELVSAVEKQNEQAAKSELDMKSGLLSVGVVDIKPDEPTRVEVTETTEFCRSIQTPLSKLEETRQQSNKTRRRGLANIPEKHEVLDMNDDGLSSGAESNGEDITEEEKKVVEKILNEELLDGGISSALKYLKTKGELSQDSWRMGRKNHENAPLHLSTKPNEVKLEYKDEFGRVMTPKEAFRYISWVFHGKGPGKKKREKMLKKMEHEKKMKVLATNPTELPTMKALQKQQKTGQSYIVLTNTE